MILGGVFHVHAAVPVVILTLLDALLDSIVSLTLSAVGSVYFLC